MPSTLHLSSGYIASTLVAIAFAILYPLVLAIIVNQRFRVSWRYFGYGALIFFLFQIITRVPLVTVIGQALAPQIKSSTVFLYTWLALLALTAGLFEEVCRYLGYRLLMRREEKTWNKAVMYGVGHGGLESMVLIGGVSALQLINLIILSSTGIKLAPAGQRAQVVQLFASINANPDWLPLLGAWERLWTFPVHIALSVIVLQVFRRRSISWLGLAILAHAVVDFVSVAFLQVLGSNKLSSSLLVELVIALFGAISIWIIWALRDKTVEIDTTEAQPVM